MFIEDYTRTREKISRLEFINKCLYAEHSKNTVNLTPNNWKYVAHTYTQHGLKSNGSERYLWGFS